MHLSLCHGRLFSGGASQLGQVQPRALAAGDLYGDGASAKRGSNALYFLRGDGNVGDWPNRGAFLFQAVPQRSFRVR